jgi:hypothetical protein
MAFLVKNDGFVCEYCGEKNPPAVKTCRNHCRKCLCSKHVDDTSPGDRMSSCGGKMSIGAVLPGTKKTDYVLLHVCEKCGKETKNRMADDDEMNILIEFSERQIYG